MNQPPTESVACRFLNSARAVMKECLLVAGVGLAFALLANQVSPYGLVLARNYFPAPVVGPKSAAKPVVAAGQSAASTAMNGAETVAARLQAHGLQLLTSNQVMQLFHDPRREQDLIVFIDARDARDYQAGHIPGAYPLDRYHPEKYLATVLPVCQGADQVVVYCQGGDCEDSEFAALMLADLGTPKTNLYVYPGGLTEWAANGGPQETGTGERQKAESRRQK